MTFLKCFSRFLFVQGRKNNIINLSAQMSYRTLSAFVPFLMLLYSFINWLSASVNETLIFAFSKILPQSIMNYVNLAMENANTISFSLGTNLILGFFILYVSVSAMHSLITSLNRIFGQKETRGTVALWIQSILYLFLFLLIIFFTVFFYLFGEKLLSFIFHALNLSQFFAVFIVLFTLLYLLIVPTLIFTLIYMYAPKNHLGFWEALPGGAFVSISWFIILLLYALFADTVLDFNSFFFNLQGPFSLFFVVYLICFSLTLGGVVNLYGTKQSLFCETEAAK
ncbi:YihY/virulence factor BrkB family protein [Acetobacterium wieringae]|uniref:YihY/virulence factor BrkB family protein n=1 Tax=Acetobacterium wieringae TaxID=52694 RepID=UPI0020337E63|nr:YihY/virulence factor BrkB family protein [Acetobacterium wieringae]URN84738.1 YihY/virulence factor BrkB family protein [Acetobacterium wieringae]